MGHSLNRTSFRINQNLVIDDKTFNPGYILVSDIYGNAGWKNPNQYISNEEPLDRFIGELYGGGIVVAVWREVSDTIYEKSLIASVNKYAVPSGDSPNFYWPWTANTLSIGTASRYNAFGASNSAAIVASDTSGFGAAAKCLSYTNEDLYGLGVYSDWYLPSTFEINCLANNAAIIDRVISQYSVDKAISLLSGSSPWIPPQMSLFLNENTPAGYWTSVEYNSGSSYYLFMGSAGVRFATASKSDFKFVRPFREDARRWNGTTWIQLEENNRRRTGQILITHNGNVIGNAGPSIVQNITSTETAFGNAITYATYSNILSQDLSIYDHIYDIGVEKQYNSLSGTVSIVTGSPNVTGSLTSFLSQVVVGDRFQMGTNTYTVSSVTSNTLLTLTSNAVQTLTTTVTGFGIINQASVENNNKLTKIMGPKYTSYLQQGGSILILGDYNSVVAVRNTNIATFITSVGGGTPTLSNDAISSSLTIGAEFLLADATNSVILGAGRFASIGTGTSITTNPTDSTTGHAVIWKTGSLSLATKGSITVVLDQNFLSNYFAVNNSSQFASNLSQILNKK